MSIQPEIGGRQVRADRFWNRLFRLALFLPPLAYVSLLLATIVHEVIGHGLAALAVGGQFDGFAIRLDAMGWAWAYTVLDASARQHLVIHAGGVVSTLAIGLAFLVAGIAVRRSIHMRLVLLVLSACSVLEGSSYLFWNAFHPVPPGDISKVLTCSHAAGFGSLDALRRVLMVVGAVIACAGSASLFFLMFRTVEHQVSAGEGLAGVRRAVAVMLLVVPAASAWFMDDWNCLAPGIGTLPNWVGAASQALLGVVMYLLPAKTSASAPTCPTRAWQIAIAWGFCAALIAAIVLTGGEFRWG